jgi:SecD/SecF fusion protein
MFALIVGVIVGTYSSLFIATPIMYDFIKKKEDKGLTKKIKEEPQEKTKTKAKKK